MPTLPITLLALLVTFAGASAATAPPRLEERLAALDPVRPSDYFELAEEIADAPRDPNDRELARVLYGLAGTLDPPRYARSAALGIADLAIDRVTGQATDDRLRRRLLGVAILLEREGGDADLSTALRPTRPSPQAALLLSESFSHVRRGQGPRALSAIRSPEVDALLESYGRALTGGASRFREDVRTFRGGLRPAFAPAQRLAMLAIEEAALASSFPAKPRSWSSVLVERNGRPLLEVDAARLDEAFGVDPSRPWWRDGRWSERK